MDERTKYKHQGGYHDTYINIKAAGISGKYWSTSQMRHQGLIFHSSGYGIGELSRSPF